jgi:peptidoglycan/xylan/chitin deacetylase (PgdA/CDA1 family)
MLGTVKSLAKALLRPWVLHTGPRDGVWLTFDDGPHPVTTLQVLDALDHAGVRATFFMIGSEMERHPSIVESVRSRGHGVALHGFDHRHAADLSWREQWADLERMRAVARRFGVQLRWYRPPYGELTALRLFWCALRGVRIVMWSFESRDSFLPDAAALVARAVPSALRSGDIALFHDDTPITAEALPDILTGASAAGLVFTMPQHP